MMKILLHLVPMASDVEAVGKVIWNMMLPFVVLQKRQIGSQSCRVMACHFESNVFFLSSTEVS